MNEKPHPADYASLAVVAISALAECADLFPAKYSGLVLLLALFARLYTKFGGGSSDALAEGKDVGQEIKTDLAIIRAKKAEPATPETHA